MFRASEKLRNVDQVTTVNCCGADIEVAIHLRTSDSLFGLIIPPIFTVVLLRTRETVISCLILNF